VSEPGDDRPEDDHADPADADTGEWPVVPDALAVATIIGVALIAAYFDPLTHAFFRGLGL
jgi:hypothetical protein